MHNRNVIRLLASDSKEHIKCVSLNNQLCQARPILVNVDSNQCFHHPFTVIVNKSVGSCNAIDDLHA